MIAASASGGWASDTSGTPARAMAAFSAAISAKVTPRYCWWSMPMLAIPLTRGRSMTLVASSRPPSPTSSRQASAGVRAKARIAAAVATSKKLGSRSPRAVEDFDQQGLERVVLDQRAGDADALVEANQMRAGEDMDREPRALERGAEHGDGRALAVGPGDMENRRQLILRPAEPVEHCPDPLEPEPVAGGRNHVQAVELRLDSGMSRVREIGHQAAAFFSGAR